MKCPCDRCHRLWKLNVSIYYHSRQCELLRRQYELIEKDVRRANQKNPHTQHMLNERLREEKYLIKEPTDFESYSADEHSIEPGDEEWTNSNPQGRSVYHLPTFDEF